MEKIISPYQTAYVSRRLINDNTIMAHEIIHSMKRKEGQSDFNPSGGIRQGDTLSPYLFILSMEWFSRTMVEAHHSKSIQGISVARGAPPINHLLFADDCLIFTHANLTSVNNLLQVLQDFSSPFGQVINFDKSSILFSNNMDPVVCDSLSNILGIQPMSKNEKYLGYPLIIGRSKVKAFEDIQVAFERRLGNWQGTTIHQAGRSTMVKAVLNSIPMYQMSTFKMPKKILKKLDSIQRKFWWGFKSNKGFNLIAWKNMCLSKDLGGLAFRDLEMMNHALLAKLAWGICHNSDNLLGQLLQAKYHKNEDFLHLHGEISNSSWVWKGIELVFSIVQQHYFMEVNNGRSTRIWRDKWIIGLNETVEPKHTSHYQFLFVSELIRTDTNDWDTRLLNILFSPKNVERISIMEISVSEEDILRWSPAKDGVFSVKSTYNKLMERRVFNQAAICTIPKVVWKVLWKMKLPHIVKFFIWKCLKNSVPTRIRLAQFNYLDDHHCSIYNLVESIPIQSGSQTTSARDDTTLTLFLDASFDYSTNDCGIGMVLCNFAGEISSVKGSYAARVKVPETGECMAVMEALSWIRDKNILKIHIAADAETVVKSITTEEVYVNWVNRKMIRRIKSILSSFSLWSVTHFKRDSNLLADRVSKRIRRLKQSLEESYYSVICIDTFLEKFNAPPAI
ncbi:uncharacterized protein LOC113326839 [Papaver somniferum]|uniref:uncharacterized protein LOC113326839 n=1 Tax=Papaver somniferum TaxID=3469 RepID=UPI000E704B99|nr:uncharacterized protein LOC113326839 [Papaver somniferum]